MRIRDFQKTVQGDIAVLNRHSQGRRPPDRAVINSAMRSAMVVGMLLSSAYVISGGMQCLSNPLTAIARGVSGLATATIFRDLFVILRNDEQPLLNKVGQEIKATAGEGSCISKARNLASRAVKVVKDVYNDQPVDPLENQRFQETILTPIWNLIFSATVANHRGER